MVTIKEVITQRELKRFIKFPYLLYKDNPYWVPPLIQDELNTLRRDRNPAFADCSARYWMAYKDGKPAGRIAGIINRKYIQVWEKKWARFGWVDFIDDPEVSAALLATVESWAREQGMEAVHGPLGFCDMDKEGLLIEGFDELPTIATIYNHPYYPYHLERLGYRKDADWIEFDLTVPAEIPPRIDKINNNLMERGHYRLVEAKRPKDLIPYVKEAFDLLNEAYRHLYAATPLSDAQVQAYVKQYFPFVSPDFVKIILDGDGRVAAFGITMRSLSRAQQKSGGRLFPFGFLRMLWALRHGDTLDLYLVAVRPDLQGKAVNSILMIEVNRSALKHGIKRAESNPELEENLKVQAQWKNYAARQHKRRRCYVRELG